MKGTASVPSFSFQGSNKTGWYLSNTNEMSAAINGVQYVTINSSGAISNATWNGTAVSATYGGTGQTTYTTGDILYASATNTISKLPAGTNGYFLGLSGGLPAWLPVGAPGSVASFSGGTTGLTPNTPTIGAIVLSGTLGAANGGTGLTSYTTGDILYATSSSAVGTLADVAVGNVLLSGGVGAAPAYGKVDLTIAVSGILPFANGGTGLSSTPANGQIDIGNGAGFTRATLTAGSGISITNGAGSVTIASTNTGTASRSFSYFVGQL